jgi:tRNA-dihydrouridine synthase A
LSEGVRLADMTRHLLGLFTGMPGARAWRRHLATYAVKSGAGLEIVRQAAALVHPSASLNQTEAQLVG